MGHLARHPTLEPAMVAGIDDGIRREARAIAPPLNAPGDLRILVAGQREVEAPYRLKDRATNDEVGAGGGGDAERREQALATGEPAVITLKVIARQLRAVDRAEPGVVRVELRQSLEVVRRKGHIRVGEEQPGGVRGLNADLAGDYHVAGPLDDNGSLRTCVANDVRRLVIAAIHDDQRDVVGQRGEEGADVVPLVARGQDDGQVRSLHS